MKINVVICTYNPKLPLMQRVLEGLRNQTLPSTEWDVTIVDNHSTDWPREISPENYPRIRMVRELRTGLVAARLCGIHHTAADLIVFVDDDNILLPNYLEEAFRLSREWPILGVFGGRTTPEMSEPLPEWMRPYTGFLGIRQMDRDSWSNVPFDGASTPIGAGMCVRRRVAERYQAAVEADPRKFCLDRWKHRLFGAGDCDLALTAIDCGLGVGSFTSLDLVHVIQPQRLVLGRVVDLLKDLQYSQTILRHIRERPLDVPDRSTRLFQMYRRWRLPFRTRALEAARMRGRLDAWRDIQNGCWREGDRPSCLS
jgi:glycosyltransferase involved in cell wall biosynthesis